MNKHPSILTRSRESGSGALLLTQACAVLAAACTFSPRTFNPWLFALHRKCCWFVDLRSVLRFLLHKNLFIFIFRLFSVAYNMFLSSRSRLQTEFLRLRLVWTPVIVPLAAWLLLSHSEEIGKRKVQRCAEILSKGEGCCRDTLSSIWLYTAVWWADVSILLPACS